MEAAAAVQLKTLLSGVPLPAKQAELLEYAVRQHAEPSLLAALQTLPGDREYASLDEVLEELLPVQPSRGGGGPPPPRVESGAPPDGDAYLEDDPEPGSVRP